MHELSTAIRGRLLRNFSRCALIGSTNGSEICLSNLTTSDVLVSFAPLVFLQKTVIASMFEEAIKESNGAVKHKDWEYTLTNPTPYYPSKLHYGYTNNNEIFLKREGVTHNFLKEITVPRSILEKDESFWSLFVVSENSFPIPGITQYLFSKYIHNYVIHGISEKKIENMIKKFPNEKYKILLSAMIYLSARELTIKDMYIAKMYS